MQDKDIENLIKSTYGKTQTLDNTQIDQICAKATQPVAFIIFLQKPVFLSFCIAACVLCTLAGVTAGEKEANTYIEKTELAAQGLQYLFSGLGGGTFL